MVGKSTLSEGQKRAIYCITHGHTPIVQFFMGYITCARCEQQLGDTLAGVTPPSALDDKIVVGHVGKIGLDGCHCNENYLKLTEADKKLVPQVILTTLKIAAHRIGLI